MPRLRIFPILLFWTQIIHALSINSSQHITVEIKFADVVATGVLSVAASQSCLHNISSYSGSTQHSLAPPFPNTTTTFGQTPVTTSPTVLATDATEQLQPTNASLSLPSQTVLSIAAIPTINITNSTNSSISPLASAFTSGSSRGRSGLLRLIESLWVMNR